VPVALVTERQKLLTFVLLP